VVPPWVYGNDRKIGTTASKSTIEIGLGDIWVSRT